MNDQDARAMPQMCGVDACVRRPVTRDAAGNARCDVHATTRPKCEAQTDQKRCGMPSTSVVKYHSESRVLCGAHAKRYAEWGDRDREQMARSLWAWPTRRDIDEAAAALAQPELA